MFHSYHAMFACQFAFKLITILRFAIAAMTFSATTDPSIAQVIINAPPTVIGDDFKLRSEEILNVSSGGEVGRLLEANDGSVVNLLGGSIGPFFHARLGSEVELTGGEFRLNNVEFTEDAITLDLSDDRDAVFTGTLADGTPFVFSPLIGDRLEGGVTLNRVALPAANPTPITVGGMSASGPSGLRSGQTLTLLDGGQLNNHFTALDATLHIEGGVVGRDSEVVRSKVNISGGEVGDRMIAYSDSNLNVSGGTIARIDAFDSAFGVSGGNVDVGVTHDTEVTISGGSVGSLFAYSGSIIEITDGNVGDEGFRNASLHAASGAEVKIAGGAIGYEFVAESGSSVELVGGEFRLNQSDYNGGTLLLGPEDIFSGTLVDGSAFVFTAINGDDLHSLRITQASVPAVDTTPPIIDSPRVTGPFGLRRNQTLTVQAGGVLPNNYAIIGATLTVDGGEVGAGVEVIEGTVNLLGGSVGAGVNNDYTFGNSIGNKFSRGLNAIDSVVNVSGGILGDEAVAGRGTVMNISSGVVGYRFKANQGSEVNLSGGAIGQSFSNQIGSSVELTGGEFRLNGTEYSGSSITLEPGDIFTGTLADGSSFLFGHQTGNTIESDYLNNATLNRVTLPAISLALRIVENQVTEGPSGLRSGQALTVKAGGILRDYFTVIDATLNVEGGSVGDGLEVINSTVNITGGEVGHRFQAFASDVDIEDATVNGSLFAGYGSVINITGAAVDSVRVGSKSVLNIFGESTMLGRVSGTLESEVFFHEGVVSSLFTSGFANIFGGTVTRTMSTQHGVANIFGGSFESSYSVYSAEVNITGGDFKNDVLFGTNSTANISGGVFRRDLRARGGSEVNLLGTQFLLDGEPLMDLEIGKPFVILDRDVTLSSILADGSPLSYLLSSSRTDYTVTVTLVPEPASISMVVISCCMLLRRGRANSRAG